MGSGTFEDATGFEAPEDLRTLGCAEHGPRRPSRLQR